MSLVDITNANSNNVKVIDSGQQLELGKHDGNINEQINNPWRGSQDDKVDKDSMIASKFK